VVTRSVSDPPIGADSDDPINPIENISAGLDTPESFAIAQDRLKAIQDEFKDDEIAWLVLECLFVDGFSPDEARKHLGLTGLEFQAARKRISRRIPKFFLLN